MHKCSKLACIILGSLCGIATVIPMLDDKGWWIQSLEFFRLQLAALLLLTALIYGFILRRRRSRLELVFLLLLLAAIVPHALRLYPYTPLVQPQVKSSVDHDEDRMSLLIANVLQENDDYDALLRTVELHSPDLILLLEVDQRWRDGLRPLEGDFEHTVLHPLDNAYGIALYSKFELRDPRVVERVQEDVPSIYTRVVLPSGAQLCLFGVHPKPPSPTENTNSTNRDAELILIGRDAESSKLPCVVAGDLNDVVWSPTIRRFQEASGLLDPRVGRGFYPTYNAKLPLIRWPLDHAFLSDELRLVEFRRLDSIGSDHFPILLTVSRAPEHSAAQADIAPPSDEGQAKNREVIDEAMDSDK